MSFAKTGIANGKGRNAVVVAAAAIADRPRARTAARSERIAHAEVADRTDRDVVSHRHVWKDAQVLERAADAQWRDLQFENASFKLQVPTMIRQ